MNIGIEFVPDLSEGLHLHIFEDFFELCNGHFHAFSVNFNIIGVVLQCPVKIINRRKNQLQGVRLCVPVGRFLFPLRTLTVIVVLRKSSEMGIFERRKFRRKFFHFGFKGFNLGIFLCFLFLFRFLFNFRRFLGFRCDFFFIRHYSASYSSRVSESRFPITDAKYFMLGISLA